MTFILDCLAITGKCILGGVIAMVGIVIVGVLVDEYRRWGRR